MSFSKSTVRTHWVNVCAGHTVVTFLPAVQHPLLERTWGSTFPHGGPFGRAQPSLHEGQGGKKVLLG